MLSKKQRRLAKKHGNDTGGTESATSLAGTPRPGPDHVQETHEATVKIRPGVLVSIAGLVLLCKPFVTVFWGRFRDFWRGYGNLTGESKRGGTKKHIRV